MSVPFTPLDAAALEEIDAWAASVLEEYETAQKADK